MGAPSPATRARAPRARARHTMNRRDYYINCTKEFAAARVYRRGKSRRNFRSRGSSSTVYFVQYSKRVCVWGVWGVWVCGCVCKTGRRQSLPG